MTFIQDRVIAREVLTGCFCTMGSTVSVEIAGHAGFDFLVLDIEHGAGDLETLYRQLQVAAGTPVAAVVRVAWNEAPRFKRALDAGADGIMVPYVQTPEEAAAAVAAMRYPPAGIRGVASSVRATRFGADFAAYRAGSDDGLLTVLQIETGEGVNAAREIAAASSTTRLRCFVMGTNDLAKEIGGRLQADRMPFLGMLGTCVLAAKAHGLAVLDGVYSDLANERGFAVECAAGRDFGFDGKTLIHPSQIGPCNAAFAPSEDELARAHKIVEAFNLPENQDKGVIKVDGQMVELLHAEVARRTVALASAIEGMAD